MRCGLYKKSAFLGRVVASGLVLLLLGTVVSCKPRGESHSIQEILTDSSQAYRKAFDGDPLPERVSSRLPELSDALSRLVDEADIERKKALSNSIVDHLRALVISAGYTTRPALGELIDQFSAVAESESDVAMNLSGVNLSGVNDRETIALLVSRTFYLLASELKGIRFQLGDREMRK